MKLVALSLSLLKALSFNSGLLEALFRPDSIYVGAKPALKVKAAALSRPRLSGRTANTIVLWNVDVRTTVLARVATGRGVEWLRDVARERKAGDSLRGRGRAEASRMLEKRQEGDPSSRQRDTGEESRPKESARRARSAGVRCVHPA